MTVHRPVSHAQSHRHVMPAPYFGVYHKLCVYAIIELAMGHVNIVFFVEICPMNEALK
jgi:hypothetical protein